MTEVHRNLNSGLGQERKYGRIKFNEIQYLDLQEVLGTGSSTKECRKSIVPHTMERSYQD
jgi:hypothetical protein